MVRRRTAVTTAVLGLLLVSPALTACGSAPARQGAAAVVGNHRITVATLQSKVNEVRTAEAKTPQGTQLLDNSGKLSSQTLTMLVQDEVIQRAAADAGVTITAGEVEQERSAALAQFGGSEQALDAAVLSNYGIGPSAVDDFLRTNVAFTKLVQALGYQPGSDTGQAAGVRKISETAKSLGVTINPRYGTWDAKNAVVGSATDPWITTRTPDAAAGPTGA